MRIIDSHTGGEPTRTIVSGGPSLGRGTMVQRRDVFIENFDHIRTTLIGEPRGSAFMVGAFLCEPHDPDNTAGVIFFNNAGVLGMCGHGAIGLVVTLHYMGQIGLGMHRIETPVGVIDVELLSPNKARIENVASYRYAKDVSVQVEGIGQVTGDIAYGGNWFFLVKEHQQCLTADNTEQLLQYTSKIQQALEKAKITGPGGAPVDHIELFGAPSDIDLADSRNFVLCPGREYDRSPCGTGTSAKMACLVADGKLTPGQIWRQQSIIGSIFEGSVNKVGNELIPSVSGEAYVNMDSTVLLDANDPYGQGF